MREIPMRAGGFAALLALLTPLASSHAEPLALKRLMLSSAGVGYFEYAAHVDGAETLGLDIPLSQVSDVLNSLVVYDAAGSVGSVELPGLDGGARAFAGVPFNSAALSDPSALLNALQGVEVDVVGPRPMHGRILHALPVAERVAQAGGLAGGMVMRTRVTLLCDDGMRQFVLEEAESVQVADPSLRGRIADAVAASRREADADRRKLTIHTSGAAGRTLALGYVVAAPVWKATYRLVLPAGDDVTARLQAWAVVENFSGQDWKDVDVMLQYGNPVTFRQDIYQAYFADRPEVPLEMLARLVPAEDTRAVPQALKAAPGGGARGLRPMGMALAAPSMAPAAEAAPAPMPAEMAEPEAPAVAEQAAEETVFHLPGNVSLADRNSAALPFLDRNFEARRVDLAQEGQTHPLASVRIANDSGTSLPGGALTLYDQAGGSPFAGDARLGGLPPGETRLLSFAEDLRTTVERHEEQADVLVSLKVAGGVATIGRRRRTVIRATISAPATEKRLVLLEIAKGDGQTLTIDGDTIDGIEATAAAWRVPVALAAGQTRTIVADRDEVATASVSLAAPDVKLLELAGVQGLSEAERAALRHLVDLRNQVDQRQAERDQIAVSAQSLDADEERVRKNLQAVGAGDALHADLVRKLGDLEGRIDAQKRALDQADHALRAADQTLSDAIAAVAI